MEVVGFGMQNFEQDEFSELSRTVNKTGLACILRLCDHNFGKYHLVMFTNNSPTLLDHFETLLTFIFY